MRVVMVFDSEVDPGAGPLAAELARRGVAVRVVCPPGAVAVFEDVASVTPLAVGTSVTALANLRRVLGSADPGRRRAATPGADPEVVHAYGLRAGLAVALARTNSLPFVVTWSEPVSTGGTAGLVGRALTRTVIPAAVAVLAPTPDLVEAAARLGAREARLLPPARPAATLATQSAEQVRDELSLPATGPIVLAQAPLTSASRLDVLVEAAARWRRPGPEAPRVVLVGVGLTYRELVAQATVARAAVTFAGDRPDTTARPEHETGAAQEKGEERASLADLLAASSVAVVTDPRARPGFALRAALAGVPLVVPEGGAVAGLLADGAVTVPAGDAAALDAAVRALLDQPEDGPQTRGDLTTAARRRVRALPDVAGVADELIGVYEKADTPSGHR